MRSSWRVTIEGWVRSFGPRPSIAPHSRRQGEAVHLHLDPPAVPADPEALELRALLVVEGHSRVTGRTAA